MNKKKVLYKKCKVFFLFAATLPEPTTTGGSGGIFLLPGSNRSERKKKECKN